MHQLISQFKSYSHIQIGHPGRYEVFGQQIS